MTYWEAPHAYISGSDTGYMVGANGLIYITDRHTGGLYIVERTG
jgi:hypothetical protein